MRLTRVRAWNFKSFRELDIRLEDLNVVIGGNASGKSNFVQLFTFIRNIAESGLENAISIQGGPKYLRNMHGGTEDKLTIELTGDTEIPADPTGTPSQLPRLTYRFSLAFNSGSPVRIEEDELSGPFFEIARRANRYHLDGQAFLGGAIVERMNSRAQEDPNLGLLLEVAPFYPLLEGLKSIATYDIDPKGPKLGTLFSKSDLDPDASNLAMALSRILSNVEDRRKLMNLLKAVLPFAEDLEVGQMHDSSLLFQMRERFSPEPMPAFFLSDGTIDVIALIVILYFERKSTVIIEEPERNLHPSLISTLVELLKDASRVKQIIVSTHNPELVRYADPPQLILMSRDASGSSHASRPADKAQVQRFLKEELGMHELYLENLLEV
jgi:predicted ATPase